MATPTRRQRGPAIAIPRTVRGLRRALALLGSHAATDSNLIEARRGMLREALARAEQRHAGRYSTAAPLPADAPALVRLLARLGPYKLGEPGRRSRRRAAARRLLLKLSERPSVQSSEPDQSSNRSE